MIPVSPGSDYPYDSERPHSIDYLVPSIVAKLREFGVKRVLDVGCGNGFLAKELSAIGMEVAGVDPSVSGIEICRANVPEASFYCIGVYDDPDQILENDFDAAVSTEVIEHLYYPRLLPRFIRKKLRPDGHVLITTPYHGYFKNLALAVANQWDRHHSPLWDGGHIKFWSQATLKKLITEEGFSFEEMIGCGRCRGFWKSMLIVGRKIDASS